MPAIVEVPVGAVSDPTVGIRGGKVAVVIADRAAVARLAGVNPGASGSRPRSVDSAGVLAAVTR